MTIENRIQHLIKDEKQRAQLLEKIKHMRREQAFEFVEKIKQSIKK
jgi:hypothetical protein